MSGEKEVPRNSIPESAVTIGETEAQKQILQKEARTGDVEQKDIKSKLSTARSAKTFIKPTSSGSKTETVQPIPWPMPPRVLEKESEEESSKDTSQERDTERDYLTPQSSFPQHVGGNSSKVTFPASEHREDSDTHSRESSVKRETFSSVGTGISLALVDSSDSASSESVSKVDIDADEFARFLSERTKSSQSVVDFTQLFAEEGQGRGYAANGNSSPSKEQHPSEFSENSSTPKAVRAPFRYRKSTKPGVNTVSLEEALNFSPDYKTVGPCNVPSDKEEGEGPGKRRDETLPEGTENAPGAESVLRRPMACNRKTFVVLPRPRDEPASRENVSEEASDKGTNKPSEAKSLRAKEEEQPETTPPVKGVIMRAQSHVSHVAGIRRAETGRIMSRAELLAQRPLVIQESPNPKSLNPAGFPNEEEDVTTVHPSTLFPESSSDSDKCVNARHSNSKQSGTNEISSAKQQYSGNPSAQKVDDGSFLSPGIFSRKKKFGTEEYRVDSFQFSEHDGSSGLLNRFSSGFRKIHLAVAKKSVSQEGTRAADTAIVVPGTIDEAVCRICVVCRKQLECDVYVKDTGKKIKVESRKDGKSRYLRATILVRQTPGESSSCEVYIRQSRSDGMKTSLATLWNFYQRLEAGLKEMG